MRAIRPWSSRRSEFGVVQPGAPIAENRAATGILDWRADWIEEVLGLAGVEPGAIDIASVQSLHGAIATHVRGVYAFDETQPTSVTWTRRRGSCSQRLAILESAARAIGVATCVRGVWVDGRFWYPRFPKLRFAIPDRVLLAWPAFHLGGTWVSASELFGTIDALAKANPSGFTNAGETLFDALVATAIDWDGDTASSASCAACNLSAEVVVDLGYFNSRDQLFAANGQTLCAPVRVVIEPLFSRRAART